MRPEFGAPLHVAAHISLSLFSGHATCGARSRHTFTSIYHLCAVCALMGLCLIGQKVCYFLCVYSLLMG